MNQQDDRLDLSALDPARNAPRWESMMHSVVARATESRRRRITVTRQMLAWAGPVLAAAAAIALVSWIGALSSTSPNVDSVRSATEPAFVLSTWAANDARPEPAQILEVLGESHGAD